MANQDYATISGTKVHRSDFAYAPEGSRPSAWKLPIHDAAHVRDALARWNQTDLPAAAKAAAWRKIVAAARKFGIEVSDKNSEFRILNSEFPRFVWMLSDLGAGMVRIGLAVTGKWVKNGEEFEITADDLELAAENFRKKLTGEINVDYDHASEMPEVAAGGPIPSAGRIVAIAGPQPYTDPAGVERQILWGDYEPTEKARAHIAAKEYRWISPAINWGARDKQTGKRQGTTLTSVALTNRPFLEELPEIRLSDPDYRELTGQETRSWKLETSGQFPVSNFQFLGSQGVTMKNLTLKHVDGAHQVLDGEEPVGVLAHDHLSSYARQHVFEAAGKEEFSEPERAATASRELTRIYLGEKVDEDAADSLLGAGAITLMELRRAERARKAIDAALQAGKLLPVDRPVAFRAAFGDPQTFDEWIAKRPAYSRLGPLSGIGGGEIDAARPRQQLAEMVRRKKEELKEKYPARSEQLLFDQATQLVRKENPELFRRYREEK